MFKQILLQLILILINAFFAATEIAILSLNENKVKSMADGGNKKAKKLAEIIEDPTVFLSTIQVGITLAGFLGSAFAADNFAEKLTGFVVTSFSVSADLIAVIDTASVIIITLILSYFTLVLGELVPKRVAMKHKEKLANGVCGVISALTLILRPIIWFLTVSTNGVLRIMGIDPHEKEEPVSEEDIVMMLDAGGDKGSIDKEEIEYIKNVFKLDTKTAADVMTPRNKIIALPIESSEQDIVGTVREKGYSRIPLYSNSIDDIVGILHVKDYLSVKLDNKFTLEKVIKRPVFVPETAHLDGVLKEMQKEQRHMAIVVDEFGATSGVLTMEDIIEELVGDIWDEQDVAEENIKKKNDGSFSILSHMSVADFFEYFHLTLPEDIESATVNGWLSEKLENIPVVGDVVEFENLQITVTHADETKSHELCVRLMNEMSEK